MRLRELRESELTLLRAAGRALARRPLPPSPHQLQFSSRGQQAYAKAVFALLCLLAVEAIAAHLLIGAFMGAGPAREILRAVLLLSSGYLALWLVGDLRLLQESAGLIVSADSVTFDIGQRLRGQVARAAILDISPEPPGDPIGGTPGAVRASAMSLPNCCIKLRTPAVFRGLYGRRVVADLIDVAIDEPRRFAEALATVPDTPDRTRPQTL